MTRRAQDNIVAALLLTIFVAAIIASMNYGPRARLVPIPIASLGAILTLAQIVLQNFRTDTRLQINLLDLLGKAAPAPEGAASERQAADKRAATVPSAPFGLKDLMAVGVVALLVVLVLALGPYAAMFIFAAGYFIAAKQYTILKALAYALGFSVLLYLMFSIILGVEFDPSPIGFGLF